MSKTRLALYGLLALVVVFLLGWIVGSSGGRTAGDRVEGLELRLGVVEARAAIAAARVDLFELNFGQAVRHLDQGRAALETLATRVREGGPEALAEPVERAIASTTEAHQLAGRMDQAAGTRAAEALRALDRAMDLLPRT